MASLVAALSSRVDEAKDVGGMVDFHAEHGVDLLRGTARLMGSRSSSERWAMRPSMPV
ncbi:hypothetical protein [Streptomyces sp. NPDC056713]|uniref:hypothetical protein n=1 Tax=unclassified Streptomyces TaxID=2593676 RepID=UPI0036B69913